MTPEEFSERVKHLEDRMGGDEEAFHGATDVLMENLLIELGYTDGVQRIRSYVRWYA